MEKITTTNDIVLKKKGFPKFVIGIAIYITTFIILLLWNSVASASVDIGDFYDVFIFSIFTGTFLFLLYRVISAKKSITFKIFMTLFIIALFFVVWFFLGLYCYLGVIKYIC